MKNIKEIQTEIKEVDATKRNNCTETQWKRLGNRRKFLNACIFYLETNPNIDFINKENARLEKKLALIDDGYEMWYNSDSSHEKLPNPKTAYEIEMKVKDFREQLRTLRFILS